jgi:hypothetical protein
MYKLILTAISMMFITLIGCTEKNITEPEQKPDPAIPFANFSSIQEKVFTPICDQPGCHGNTNNQANLFLAEGQAYSNIVGVPSLLFPGITRVIPDSSSKSLIIKILKGEVSPRMPLGGPFLEDAVIDSIAEWIDNGAINN